MNNKYTKIFNKFSVLVVLAVAFVFGLTGLNTVHAVTPPDRGLGAANSYSVFGKAGVTETLGATTHVWGNAGADSSVGLISSQVGGAIVTDGDIAGVATDASSTYDSLMSALQGTPAGTATGLDLAGTHTGAGAITPGVYTIGSTTMNGAIELKGAGVYIFRSDASATIAATSAAIMTLTNGACASNVFWAIPASMTIGTYAHIEGTIIAQTGLISLATGATLVGRAISLTKQVTLDANQITEPICSTTGTLHVIKTLNNLHGGTLHNENFSFSVNDEAPVAFESDGTNDLTVAAGTYSVTETAVAGYATSYNTCTGLDIASGGSATCTITNNDIAPHLIVIKHVVNDNGGSALASTFLTTITDVTTATPTADGAESPGVDNILTSVGAYSIDEDAHAGYTKSFSGDCSGTIALGQTKTCTITNNDIAPASATLHVIKTLINDSGGTSNETDFSFSINGGTAQAFEADGQNDLSISADTYTVTEPTAAGYSTSYDNCSDLVVASGGSATCTITNDDIAVSEDNVISEDKTADKEDDLEIKITKKASPAFLPLGPGLVIYTYKVTNEGDVSLKDVSVKDDKCSPVVYVSGRKNKNGKLDTNETWKYSCAKRVSATETNKATAKGAANGKKVHDHAKATVVVSSVPGFPNAGIGPDME